MNENQVKYLQIIAAVANVIPGNTLTVNQKYEMAENATAEILDILEIDLNVDSD